VILRRHPRPAAGLGALAVLALMAALLHWKIAPLTDSGFLPQLAFRGYSSLDLQAFGTELLRSGEGGLYRNILRLDLLFMGLWGLWVVLAFPDRRAVGMALAGVVLVCDLAENVLLQQALDWAMGRSLPTGWVLYPPLIEDAQAVPFTRAKLVLYPLVTGGLLLRDLRR